MRWLPAACIVLAGGSARGEDVEPEIAVSRISATLTGTNATIKARLDVKVRGPATELGNQLHLELPGRAVVTGATVREGAHVTTLELARVATVDEKFTALDFQRSNGTDRRWAMRIDAGSGDAVVGVAAPHSASLTLDVTFEAPTCFFDDVRYVSIPHDWVRALPASYVPRRSADEMSEACGNGNASEWLALLAPQLATHPGGEGRIGVVANRLSVASKDIAQVEVSIASKLTDIPADLHTVIVVDHSRSLTAAQRESERAIVEAYLRAAPRGRVQVIGYARTAAPVLAGWMNATMATTRIDRALRDLPPRNGSNLDEGLAAAGAWLSNIHGTRRVIILSDEQLAWRISADPLALRSGLPEGTLVHAVNISTGNGTLFRSDGTLLAPLALATGGIAVSGGPDDDGHVDAMLLARPTSIDNFSIQGVGWEASFGDSRQCPLDFELFSEGSSCTWWGTGKPSSGDLRITGALWGTTITKTVTPDATRARSVARLLTTLDTVDSELLKQAEAYALAVNSMWSLFAMWGPSGGYDEIEKFGIGGGGSFSCCHSIRTSSSDRGRGTTGRSLESVLRQQLAGAVARCRPRAAVTVRVETTLDEIVNVDVAVSMGDESIRDCITDGIWDVSLSLPQPPGHANSKLTFQPS